MRVAVIGSYDPGSNSKWPLRENEDTFRKACMAIGKALAANNHQLSVQYERTTAADPYVADGYCGHITGPPGPGHRIQVWAPPDDPDRPFEGMAGSHYGLFTFEDPQTKEWDSARLEMCSRADLIIAIGGGSRTETAGIAALHVGIPMLPIASFGGAAQLLLGKVEHGSMRARHLPTPLTAADLRMGWTGAESKVVASIAMLQPVVVIIHGHNVTARDDVVGFLKTDLGLPHPRIMVEEYRPGETIPNKWERIGGVNYGVGIAIASADDLGGTKSGPADRLRARQNVWVEIGWFWGRYGNLSRLLILPQETVEGASDIVGAETFHWSRSPLERKDVIQKFVESHWGKLPSNSST